MNIKTSSCNDLFIMRTSSIIDEYGIENIASVILRKDNPRKEDIIEEFNLTIGLFQNKP